MVLIPLTTKLSFWSPSIKLFTDEKIPSYSSSLKIPQVGSMEPNHRAGFVHGLDSKGPPHDLGGLELPVTTVPRM